MQAACEFVKKNYPKNDLYAFGISLGGIMLVNYLIKGQNVDQILKAAILYGAPLQPEKSQRYFDESHFGLFNYALGLGLIPKLKSALNEIKPMMEPQEHEILAYNLEKCKKMSEIDSFV